MKGKEFLKKRRKWLIAAAVLAVIGAAAFSFVIRAKKSRQAPRAVKAQETAQVERRSLKETVSASGKIVSAKNKEVNTTLSGIKVKEVKVKVGDTVEAGDVICVFDTTDLELDLADAQATLKASGGKTAVDLAGAQRGLSEAQTTGEIDTARANADESDAYNDYLKAKTDEEEAKNEYLEAQQAVIDKNGEWEAAKKRMEEAENEMAKAKGKADGLSAAAGKADGFATEFSNTVNELASIIPADHKADDVKSFLYIDNQDLSGFTVSKFVNDSAGDEVKNRVETYLGTLKGLQESYLAAKKEKSAYDAANAEYQAAQAAYQTAQQEVSSWETKYNSAKNSESSCKNAYEQAVSSSDSKYDTYEQKVRSKDDTVRNSASTVSGKEDALTNSQLNASTAQLSDKKTVRQLEEKIESCTVTAPIGGVVTSVNVAEGDSFSGTTVAVIENIADFKVEANIDEYDIPKIKEGQSVVIKTNGTGDAELNGTVEKIAPRANSSDSNSSVTYKITVSVDTPGEELRMDMTAKLSIVIESREDVLTVPYDAVQEADDGTYYVQLVGEDSGTGWQSGQGADGAGTQTGQNIGGEKEQAGQTAGETTGQPPTGTGQEPGSQGMFPGSGSLPDGAAAGVTTAGRRITVEKGIESDYYIEVVSDELTEGMEVIVPASEESGTDARGMIDMQGPMGGF